MTNGKKGVRDSYAASAFGTGPLTSEEKRILFDGGAFVPVSSLCPYLQKILGIELIDVFWINSAVARKLISITPAPPLPKHQKFKM